MTTNDYENLQRQLLNSAFRNCYECTPNICGLIDTSLFTNPARLELIRRYNEHIGVKGLYADGFVAVLFDEIKGNTPLEHEAIQICCSDYSVLPTFMYFKYIEYLKEQRAINQGLQTLKGLKL